VKMNFEKTTTSNGILCISFNELKYRFLREIASGNVSLRCTKQKCSARIEMNNSMTIIIRVSVIVNDHDILII